MSGLTSRNKGKVGERATARELRDVFPEFAAHIKRGWQTRSGADEPDVMGIPGFWIEIKTLRKFRTSPIEQAEEDSPEDLVPIAVIRPNRKDPVVMVRWCEFLKLLREVINWRNQNERKNSTRSGRSTLQGSKGRSWRIRVHSSNSGRSE